MKTKSGITMTYGKGGIQVVIRVPEGTRVRACNDGSGEYFVDNLDWLDPRTQGMTLHDATYYGIRLAPEHVT